ncbi:hypothetical protein TREMEDRAFT_67516 [Tremella mesenterica DSM 1558]|uniref:uncharacterized protein n=1 Tax=Tremella mesenterica (strain ATCC 24925 / CBS 8224 / DSM 1558 / NBRC 9311 / NRRL Y-6157 / RJB 2259-6 / UBC 559-6) TaxID=578456 RepID=UPI0003F49FB9|nr:uncharacterized protein TREMEDRAFT_67516 [Tremella mesenterica DSM 1558]EIW70962.1 hypothetical protein TREMEDRAFT_67516 [Tremella mesenterica DSM 1558]
MTKELSFQDFKVPVPGFGCMSFVHPDANDEESLKVLRRVRESGCTFWDTAAVYGLGSNESLLGRFFKEEKVPLEEIFLASKCGFDIRGDVTNSPEHIRSTLASSTERLGRAPDLYYLHRIDPNTPLEQSITTLKELKDEGKCRYIGLSEPSAATLRKACSIAHIDAIQIEYSPWFTDHETITNLIPTAKELNVTIIAYSPLGRGVLTGKYRDTSKFKKDIRATIPRYNEENYEKNLKLVDEFGKLAEKKGCTAGQLAIAWVMKKGFIPIPGTKNIDRFEENWGSREVELNENDLKGIEMVVEGFKPVGDRYNEDGLSKVGR